MLIVYIQHSTGIHGQSIQEIERKGGHLYWKGGCQIPLFIDNMVLRMEHLKDFIRTHFFDLKSKYTTKATITKAAHN